MSVKGNAGEGRFWRGRPIASSPTYVRAEQSCRAGLVEQEGTPAPQHHLQPEQAEKPHNIISTLLIRPTQNPKLQKGEFTGFSKAREMLLIYHVDGSWNPGEGLAHMASKRKSRTSEAGGREGD